MKQISRAAYTIEFKVAAVHQVLTDKRAADVGRELGLVERTLHNWSKAYLIGELGDANNKTIALEQMENSRLRAKLAEQKWSATS